MSYHDLLYRYGYEQGDGETRLYIYAVNPKKLETPKDVIYRDKDAATNIERLEKLIEDLKDYRQALAARYGELETMPYTRLLKLERRPHWKGHIEYIVAITKTHSDGTKVQELREVYPGKERRQAIARYQELQKQRPGIESVMDIEKMQWEK
ncbi:MAG: hypothetical protein ACI4PH_11345 [Faecousia sp.]